MFWFNKFHLKKAFALALVLTTVSFFFFSSNLVARANFFADAWNRFTSRWEQASGDPPGGRARGGGARGSLCALAERDLNPQLTNSVVALVPVKIANQDDSLVESTEREKLLKEVPDTGSVGGLAVEEHPTFWFYTPYISDTPQIQVAQFVLLDKTQHLVWNELIAIELTQTAQMIEYSLPYALETGKLYNWYFSAICDPEKPSRNSSVQGWVQRIESDNELRDALRNAGLLQEYATNLQQYRAYTNSGIWFEAINALVKSRRQSPNVNQFQADWVELLAYFGIPQADELDPLTPAKIVEREVVHQSQLPAKTYGAQ